MGAALRRLRRLDRQKAADGLQLAFADAINVVELVHAGEGAVLFAVAYLLLKSLTVHPYPLILNPQPLIIISPHLRKVSRHRCHHLVCVDDLRLADLLSFFHRGLHALRLIHRPPDWINPP